MFKGKSDLEKALDTSNVTKVTYNGIIQPILDKKLEMMQQSVMELTGCDLHAATDLIAAIIDNKLEYIGWRVRNERIN